MTGAADFDFAASTGAAANQRGVLSGDGALAEDAIGYFEEFIERQIHAREAAEHGVEMGHEQGSGNAFARDIAEQKNEFAIVIRRENQIAIIAADHSGGMVAVVDAPVLEADVAARQQATLDTRGEFEIALKGALLVTREMIEAERDERIGEQPVCFYRAVAGRADSVGAFVHAVERGIHFAEQIEKRSGGTRGRGGRDHCVQFIAAFFELLTNVGVAYSGHLSSLRHRGSHKASGDAIRFRHANSPLPLWIGFSRMGSRLSIYGVQQGARGLLLLALEAIETLQAVLELGFVAAMQGRREGGVAAPALEFAEGCAYERGGASGIIGYVFMVYGELLVGFEAFAGIAEDAFPELAGERQVACAFGQAGQGAAGSAIGFGRQFRG